MAAHHAHLAHKQCLRTYEQASLGTLGTWGLHYGVSHGRFVSELDLEPMRGGRSGGSVLKGAPAK
jgi:hypothetical protein